MNMLCNIMCVTRKEDNYILLFKYLDLTKAAGAELFEKIEKIYAARFSSNVSKQEFAKAIPLRYCFFCFLSLLMKVYYSFLNQYLLFTF